MTYFEKVVDGGRASGHQIGTVLIILLGIVGVGRRFPVIQRIVNGMKITKITNKDKELQKHKKLLDIASEA